MTAVGEERQVDAVEDCRFGWYDEQGHVCGQAGSHPGHTCKYCGAEHTTHD